MAGIDAARPARDGVYAMSAGGGDLRRLTAAPRGRPQRPLEYSPDGRSLLLFQRDRNGRFGTLYVIRRDGRVTRVSSPGGVTCCYFGSPASWSPDGRGIAFSVFNRRRGVPPGLSAVFVASAGGGNAHRITDWGDWTTSARWSPTGDWIAFDKVDSGVFHSVFLIHPDGSDQHMVDADPAATGSCVRAVVAGREVSRLRACRAELGRPRRPLRRQRRRPRTPAPHHRREWQLHVLRLGALAVSARARSVAPTGRPACGRRRRSCETRWSGAPSPSSR